MTDPFHFSENSLPNPDFLVEIAETRMPFGKYKDFYLLDLPEPYIIWLAGKGLPEGKLGQMLEFIYEIKLNGLEYLFEAIHTHDE